MFLDFTATSSPLFLPLSSDERLNESATQGPVAEYNIPCRLADSSRLSPPSFFSATPHVHLAVRRDPEFPRHCSAITGGSVGWSSRHTDAYAAGSSGWSVPNQIGELLAIVAAGRRQRGTKGVGAKSGSKIKQNARAHRARECEVARRTMGKRERLVVARREAEGSGKSRGKPRVFALPHLLFC